MILLVTPNLPTSITVRTDMKAAMNAGANAIWSSAKEAMMDPMPEPGTSFPNHPYQTNRVGPTKTKPRAVNVSVRLALNSVFSTKSWEMISPVHENGEDKSLLLAKQGMIIKDF